MTCKETLDKLQDYLDGDLKDKYTRGILQHLNTCPSCREEYNALKRLGDLFKKEKIELPDVTKWNKTWESIEIHLSAPRVSWFREIMVTLDTLRMQYLGPRQWILRSAYSLGIFAIGIIWGAMFISPSGEVYQRVVKTEHNIREVPVVKEMEIVKYLEKNIARPQITERVIEKPKIIYVANAADFESAPVFPANDELDLTVEGTGLWSPKMNVDHQIDKIKSELAPTFYNNNSDRYIRLISTAE